jgi:hypothetical protein
VCCDLPEAVLVPPPVAAMLAEYRRLQSTSVLDWGREVPALPGAEYGRFLDLGRLWPAVAETGDWSEALRRCIPDPPPRGLIVARVSGAATEIIAGPLPLLVPGTTVEVGVLIDSRSDDEVDVAVDGSRRRVAPRGVVLTTATVDRDHPTLTIGGTTVVAGEGVEGARLRLRAGAISRWSVVDEVGQAWFPEDRLHKWDYHGRPFFHGDDVLLDVPARTLHVSCARGMEFTSVSTTVLPERDVEVLVELDPQRVYDAAARGWYGGDLHVHMNYSGDLVCGPHDAALMQRGEGLHLMNLVAGNLLGARIYDREAFEHFAGSDLPWSAEDQLGRWSVEFRNDMLGHFHAFAPTTPPVRYQTGHSGSEHPEDWPPNSVACEDLRARGATIGYTHPVLSPLEDGTPADAFGNPRSTEARELVADAALGLVDSVDLLGPNDPEGTALLYHHLLNCGLRLAATVGTDVFLSHARSSFFSNPPGWGRVYAHLEGERLSAASWQRAVRAGRTFATNGPWLELEIDGHGPGTTIEVSPGLTLRAHAHVDGPGVETLELVGPDGPVATTSETVLDAELPGEQPGWLVAVARGPQHPSVLGPSVFAHTSPVYLDVDGRRVARAASADWCLDWLDRVERLASEHGHFADEAQWSDLVAVLDRARHFYRWVTTAAAAGRRPG